MLHADKKSFNQRIVIMGIGNLLLGDDGVGVHAVRALQNCEFPENVLLLDVGTAFVDAAYALDNATHIIVLDAIRAQSAVGSVYRVLLEKCRQSTYMGSLHGFDIFRMLALSQNECPPENIVVYGVEPASIDCSLELSEPVTHALPELVAAVAHEVAEMIGGKTVGSDSSKAVCGV